MTQTGCRPRKHRTCISSLCGDDEDSHQMSPWLCCFPNSQVPPLSLSVPARRHQAFISCHVQTVRRPRGHNKRHVVVFTGTPDLKGHPLVIPLGDVGWFPRRDGAGPLSLSSDTDDTAVMDPRLYSGVPVVNLRPSICLSSKRSWALHPILPVGKRAAPREACAGS